MFDLQARLDAVLSDRTSGSRVITTAIVEALQTAELPDPFPRASFIAVARRVLARAPVFALVHDLLHTLGRSCFESSDRQNADAALLRAAAARWHHNWRKATDQVTVHAAERLAGARALATLSNSGAVFQLLKHLHQHHRRFTVLCAESVPGREGVIFAERVRRIDHAVEVVADALLPERLTADTVLVCGADSVAAGHFINKVGTSAAVASARAHGRPALVLAETAKWAPPAWGVTVAAKAPPGASTDPGCDLVSAHLLFEAVEVGPGVTVVGEQGPAASPEIGLRAAGKAVFGPLCA